MFKVQRKQCATCIYRRSSRLDLKRLEDQVRDGYGGMKGHRVCHHSKDACCAGFWRRWKNRFQLGQIAQRLGFVTFVQEDILDGGK